MDHDPAAGWVTTRAPLKRHEEQRRAEDGKGADRHQNLPEAPAEVGPNHSEVAGTSLLGAVNQRSTPVASPPISMM